MDGATRISTNILLLLLAALASSPIANAARQPDVQTWISRDLTPFVTEQLTTHPRFKRELVKFVVFEDGNPAPRSNALAVSLRDQLADAVIDVPGVRVGWPDSAGDQRNTENGTAIDCARDNVHYLIGLEVSDSGNGQFKIDLRALDLEERSWVAGFTKSWQGKISRSERRAFQQPASDRSFLGQRSVPFNDTQPDLLAAYLAHDLGCALLRQVSGEFRVTLEPGDEQSAPLDNVVELISNNLSGYQALQVTKNAANANAVLKGKAHHIDDNLYQYWIIVAPADSDSDLPTLSASAYIQLPESHATNSKKHPLPAETFSHDIVERGDAKVLSSVRIVELKHNKVCDSGSVSFAYQFRSGTDLQYWHDDCYALQVKTKADAVVFFLNHQLNHGLVRLSGRECRQNTEARIARANETVDYALPLLSLTRDASSAAHDWQINPEADTYYAIAVSDTKAARALSKHLEQLPRRCTISVRPGLEGSRLENWLQDFSAVVEQWQPHIDWQAIRVRNVF